MTEREKKILTERLIPVPQKVDFRDGRDYIIADGCQVKITASDIGGGEAQLSELFKNYWNAVPKVNIETAGVDGCCDSYKLSITENLLHITARCETGILNAMKTLRQLAEVQRGTETVSGYFLVQCEIDDFPAMPFRGVHLCLFPETPMWDIEKQIRVAAAHKFNYAVIEPWGIFPFESHPEFCWCDKKLDKTELKRLIALGKSLGITLIPQLNLLGHASGCRSITAKHAVLNQHPALQPLFEPEGWSWCLTNSYVRKILTDMVLELHDFFDCPPYFHIGCDEADNIATCRDCRKKELKTLIKEHIVYFHNLFAARNTRVMMWHDMLVVRGDPRWKGYTTAGLPEHKCEDLYKELPRDIIIADWQYGYKKQTPEDPEPDWPTTKFFKQAGFDVLVCPWKNREGTASLGRLAAQEKFLGLLATTWHIFHGDDFASIYNWAAFAAWNPAVNTEIMDNGKVLSTRLSLAQHTRQAEWDMGITEYARFGWVQNQVDPGDHPHQER